VAQLDRVKPLGDEVDPVRVPREQDVVGQLARPKADVVLPLAGGGRDAGIHGRQRLGPSWLTLVRREAVPEDMCPIRAPSSVAALEVYLLAPVRTRSAVTPGAPASADATARTGSCPSGASPWIAVRRSEMRASSRC